MNTVIEIHDSTVAGIVNQDSTMVVVFQPAYLHKSHGRPGIDPGTGWIQNARLIFDKATITGDFPDWPCDMMDGELFLDGERHRNFIPVPLEVAMLTELRLICDSVHTITIKSQRLDWN